MQNGKLFTIVLLFSLLAGCAGLAPLPAASQVIWPTSEWGSSSPEAQGMDSNNLAGMFQQIEAQQLNLHSLLVVRHGVLVTEAYYQPYTKDQPHYLASVTKSVIGTLVGVAIQKGLIRNTDQTVVSFFPNQTIAHLDDWKKSMTLKDLLSLTAGLKCNDSPFSGETSMEQSPNWVQYMLDVPMVEQPGTKFNYCGGAVHLLSAILQKTTGMSAREFANQSLFQPLGIAAVPETGWARDPQGISTGPYGLTLTPRDMAKLGYLYLHKGKWDQQQILPAGWVDTATSRHTTKENGLGYGYLWTVDPQQKSYSALGLAGQEIYVIPDKDLVVVFTAVLPSTQPDMDYLPLKALVDSYILPAVNSDQALPENKTALAQLNEHLQKAAHPQEAVKPASTDTLTRLGRVYQLDDNPSQWKTIAFDYASGSSTMTVVINGQAVDPPMGLDHIFRIQKSVGGNPQQAIRGSWENDHTLFIQLLTLGQLADSEFRVVFSKDSIDIQGKNILNGQQMSMHGTPIRE